MVEDVCDRHVIGSDPFRIERLWRDVYGQGYTGRPDISLVGVLSGIEMACWDIVGKAVRKPVYELLGGSCTNASAATPISTVRPGTRPMSISIRSSRPSGRRRTWREGFTALKFDPAGAYSTFDPRQPGLVDLSARSAT